MPLFEYICRGCGHKFEALVMGRHAPDCPRCASSDLEKLFSSFGARTGSDGAARRPSESRFT